MTRRRPVAHHREAGFSLLEALVALTLLALGLVLGLALIYRLPASLDRARARVVAVRAAEAALETLRVGSGPLPAGETELPAGDGAPARRLRIGLAVEATEVRGLYHVVAQARYEVRGTPESVRLETRFWRALP
ncbi:MAG TPA: prepilin-type N-terminal cleavage/methylation domain-containing protein [Thermoanaerobaculia bacterium]|nr:prepilin-type N-terminal cleavage/methylation domain-containing protein [Thermoanaerobaculia bacterium]